MHLINKSIACDVKECRYNAQGKNCSLGKIKVTCGEGDLTNCQSFDVRD